MYTHLFPCHFCEPKIIDIKNAIQKERKLGSLPFTVVYSELFGDKEKRDATRAKFEEAKISLQKMEIK